MAKLRLILALLVLPVLMGASSAVQPFPLLPTYEFDYQAAGETPQRGKSATAVFARATTGSYISFATNQYADLSSNVVGMPAAGDIYDSGEATLSLPTSSVLKRGVLLGQANVYVLLRNTALDNAAWTVTGASVVTADTQADPFGATTMDDVADDDAGAAEEVHQAVTIADDSSSWTVSGWAKCGSSHSVLLQLALSGGTPVSCTTTFTCNSTPKKAFCTVANNTTGNTTATVTLFGTTGLPANTGTAAWGYAQLYNKAYVVMREEETAGATVTVNEDDLSYSAVSVNDTGTICGWFYPRLRKGTGDNNALFAWGLGGTDTWEFYAREDGTLALDTGGLADDMLTISTGSIGDYSWAHLCVGWTQATTSAHIYVNGVEVSYSDAVDSWSAGGDYGTTLSIGGNSAGRVDGDHVIAFFQYWAGRELNAQNIKQVYNRTKVRGGF